MDSTKATGKAFDFAAGGGENGNTAPEATNIQGSGSGQGTLEFDQLNHDKPDSSAEEERAKVEKKPKNRVGVSAPWWGSTPARPPAPAPASKVVGQYGGYNVPQANDSRRPVGRGNSKSQPPIRAWETSYCYSTALKKWLAMGRETWLHWFQTNTEKEEMDNAYPRGQSVGGYDSDSDAVPKQSDDTSHDDDDDDALLQD